MSTLTGPKQPTAPTDTAAIFSAVIALAESHVEDWRTGIAEGYYGRDGATELAAAEASIKAARAHLDRLAPPGNLP